jgi:dephospho-CoA kinase
MKIVGITGGIGSGKSTVCEVFKAFGVAVFHADDEAKRVYDDFPEVLEKVRGIFGSEVFHHGKLNKSALAVSAFGSPEKLKQLNALVHPYVAHKFKVWMSDQSGPYVLREAAILIESGSYKDCSEIILVTAPMEVRMSRITKRGGINPEQIKQRMQNQMTDEERLPYADYVINNDGKELILPQIDQIHHALKGEITG